MLYEKDWNTKINDEEIEELAKEMLDFIEYIENKCNVILIGDRKCIKYFKKDMKNKNIGMAINVISSWKNMIVYKYEGER